MPELPADTETYLAQRLSSVLPADMLSLLKRAATLAGERGWGIYLVGGYVRDVLLRVPDYDVDVSVVGDAVALAEALARETGARLETHGRFGTARLAFDKERAHLDLVTARKESYLFPGALPVVEAGGSEDDLARRDFTVNAMAVAIEPQGIGTLLDPHGGIEDLRAGLIRVLHEGSFRDDPTRIFRAVKLAERLGFKIEQGTLEAILLAVRDGALLTISTDRAVHQFLLILEEPKAGVMLATLDKLGVLWAIRPGLTWPYPDAHISPSEQANLSAEERRDAYLAILAAEYSADPQEAEELARALGLPAPTIRLMRDSARLMQLWPQLGEDEQSPSQTYNLLKDLDVNALAAYGRLDALAADTVAWERLHRYLNVLRHVKPVVTGDYLKSLSVPPGPIYKQLLDDLLAAKLDGEVADKANEEQFARDWLRREGLLTS